MRAAKKHIRFSGRTHWEALEAKMLYFLHPVGALSFILEGKKQWFYTIWIDTYYE